MSGFRRGVRLGIDVGRARVGVARCDPDGLLAVPFDGSLEADRALAVFMNRWVARLQRSVVVHAEPPVRSGHVSLDVSAWHDVAVLKFLQERFVLHRPDLAVYQRGQATVLERLVDALTAWLDDPHDVRRAPRRLLDLVDLAREDYARLNDVEHPSAPWTREQRRRLATGRGVVDYVASLTDAQALSLAGLISGGSERLWDAGQGL